MDHGMSSKWSWGCVNSWRVQVLMRIRLESVGDAVD